MIIGLLSFVFDRPFNGVVFASQCEVVFQHSTQSGVGLYFASNLHRYLHRFCIVLFASYLCRNLQLYCIDFASFYLYYYLCRFCVVFASYFASELHRFCVVLVLRSFAKVASQPALKLHRCCVPVLRLLASILHRCLP